jgi:FkbM family methyltransferase
VERIDPIVIDKLKRCYNAAIYQPRRMLRRYLATSDLKMTRLGTTYGGWTVADTPELRNGVAVLCGAGEDVSFDLALQKLYGCDVLIVDPTPRAIEHFRRLTDARSVHMPFPINNGNESYQFDGVDFTKIRYLPFAIWHSRASLKFWMPLNGNDVSHSLTNLQGSAQYIEVNADSLLSILSEQGYQAADLRLLKMDIEGAEAEVIGWLCKSAIFPQQILVEFDEVRFPSAASNKKIKKTVERLLECGYKLIHYDGISNCLFLR